MTYVPPPFGLGPYELDPKGHDFDRATRRCRICNLLVGHVGITGLVPCFTPEGISPKDSALKMRANVKAAMDRNTEIIENLYFRPPSRTPFMDLLASGHIEVPPLPEGYVPPPPSCDAEWEIGEPCDGGVTIGCHRKPGHKGPHLGYHDNSYGEGRIVWTTPCHHEEE